METEQMDRIFDPYFTTKEFGQGMGMGLSIVQGICNRLDARIHVESHKDSGTVFRIFFPCVPSEKKAVLIPIRDLPTGKERILLVDDEASFTAALSKMLQRLGYQVKSVTHPTEALESFEADPEGFDLIVSDMVMSPMAGDRLIERIKMRRPEIPAILMSGLTDRADLKEDRRALMDAVVRKPVSINEIAIEIRRVLDRPPETNTMPA
jgi:CheY-like chemotaxis protein